MSTSGRAPKSQGNRPPGGAFYGPTKRPEDGQVKNFTRPNVNFKNKSSRVKGAVIEAKCGERPASILLLKQARVKEGKGTAACYHTVCARWYFKPASGSELDEAARVGVAPDEGEGEAAAAAAVSCWRNTQVFPLLQSTAESFSAFHFLHSGSVFSFSPHLLCPFLL